MGVMLVCCWWGSVHSYLERSFFRLLGSPYRWCAHRLGAIKGIFGEIATYIVRKRGWSVVLAIAMGLEGYRHQLPLIERYPSSVPGNFVTYEDMPTGAQQRALAMRGAWIDRHLNDVAQTFSKLVVTSADIGLLLRAIEADQTLVHAAYYSDDECIARIADWIAANDDLPQRLMRKIRDLAWCASTVLNSGLRPIAQTKILRSPNLN